MFEQKKDELHIDRNDDGINRRGFLECMAWAGTGVVWTIGSGDSQLARFRQTGASERGQG